MLQNYFIVNKYFKSYNDIVKNANRKRKKSFFRFFLLNIIEREVLTWKMKFLIHIEDFQKAMKRY